MLVIGLTGGIATGKSTVSALLKAHSVPVVDADVIARQVVLPGTRALRQIVDYFGYEVLLPDGSLDRPKLGTVIFGDEGKRRMLNSIIHPAVRRVMLCEVLKAWVRGCRFCVIDIPLLIETGLHDWVGFVVVVSCHEETQLQRLMGRDNSTEEAALSRVKSQMPISSKAAYADVVIDNSGPLDELENKVRELVKRLESKTRWTWLMDWLIPPVGVASAVLTLVMRRCLQSRARRRKHE